MTDATMSTMRRSLLVMEEEARARDERAIGFWI